MNDLIYMACQDRGVINAHTFLLLSTELDIDDLYDLIEMKEVTQSVEHAMHANMTAPKGPSLERPDIPTEGRGV